MKAREGNRLRTPFSHDDRTTHHPVREQAGPGSPLSFPGTRRSLQVDVGPPTLGDLPDLYRLPGIELLNQPDSLLASFSPFRTALRARLRWPRSRRRVLVARTTDRAVGYALFQPQRPDGRWRLDAIGAAIGIYDSVPVIEELLREGITLAGLNGVKRLYARVPQGAFAANGLRSVGFSPYTTERVFVADGLSPRRMPRHVRSQQPADTWAIHQLYSAAVPRQVQYAEAFTSHRWDMPAPGSNVTVDGLVIEEGHHIVGMARIVSRASGHCVELITLPERAELIHDLIDGVAALLDSRPGGRLYATARGYHQEIASAFGDRGMTALHEQDLLIKYTTANVRLPVFEATPAFVEVREGVPHRVPTYLQPQPRDDTVT